MNLSTVGAVSRTVGAFVSRIDEEADPFGHCYVSRPCHRASADAKAEEAPVFNAGHRQVSRAHSCSRLSLSTPEGARRPRWASGARHPGMVSVLIHIV